MKLKVQGRMAYGSSRMSNGMQMADFTGTELTNNPPALKGEAFIKMRSTCSASEYDMAILIIDNVL